MALDFFGQSGAGRSSVSEPGLGIPQFFPKKKKKENEGIQRLKEAWQKGDIQKTPADTLKFIGKGIDALFKAPVAAIYGVATGKVPPGKVKGFETEEQFRSAQKTELAKSLREAELKYEAPKKLTTKQRARAGLVNLLMAIGEPEKANVFEDPGHQLAAEVATSAGLGILRKGATVSAEGFFKKVSESAKVKKVNVTPDQAKSVVLKMDKGEKLTSFENKVADVIKTTESDTGIRRAEFLRGEKKLTVNVQRELFQNLKNKWTTIFKKKMSKPIEKTLQSLPADDLRGMTSKLDKITTSMESLGPQEIAKQESKLAKLYNTFKKKTDLPESKTTVKNLLRERFGNIGEASLESQAFSNSIKQKLSSAERETLPFIMEKTDVPKQLNRPDLIKIYNNPSPQMQAVSEEARGYLDEAHEFLVKEVGEDIGFIENYVTHIWDIPKEKMQGVTNWFSTIKNNPHLKKRSIKTIKAGVEELGLTPKTLDIADLIRIYDDWKIKTVHNTRFAKSLVEMTDETGQKLIQRTDKAPDDWVKIDHPVLNRAIGSKLKTGEIMIKKVPVKVHPDIAKEVNVIFQQPFSSDAIRALETFNAFIKKTQLSISLFHHLALTEVAVPILGVPQTLKIWNPFKIIENIKNNNYDIFNKLPVAKDAVKHGLQLGALEDVNRSKVHNTLQALEARTKSIPLIGRISSKIRSANDLWDTVLWDYLHNTLKLNAYETEVARQLKRNPTKDVDMIKDEVAQFGNDTFGGQAWELLSKTPRWRQVMQWSFLSPDWTVSTIRQALSPTGLGAVHKATKGIRQKAGVEFWVKAMAYFWGAMNVWNYSNTKREFGEGKWMWENDPGHKTLVFLGFDEDGRKEYLRWGKQFREAVELVQNPLKKIGGKLSPAIQQLFIQLTGSSASGYRTDLAEEMEAGKSFWETLPTRGKELLKLPVPFAITGIVKSKSPLAFAFPISKGLGKWEGRQYFREAIEDKDIDRVKEVYTSLLENGFDAESVYKQSISDFKREATYDAKDEAKELYKQLKKIDDPAEGRRILQELREKEMLTPAIEKQLLKIAKEKEDVKIKQKRLGIFNNR